MIRSFRHKGHQRFFESGSTAGVQAAHGKRLAMILAALDTVTSTEDLQAIRRLRLHSLKGQELGRWSVLVNGNWRITFEFRELDVYVLDYEDYH